MQLHPTRVTLHVALAGAAVVALGSVLRHPAEAAFGGAMLLAVAFGRGLSLLTVTRLREAGFEMVWSSSTRVHRVVRGGTVDLIAEIRNRSDERLRCVGLRPVVSAMLSAEVHPTVVSLEPRGRTRVTVRVRAPRIGRWGVHGLALEVRAAALGGEGLCEVPLLFASPLGIEVLPPALASLSTSPRGGRARRSAETGRPAAAAGEGDELRELRDHVPGDAFKRIAWKASARRGRLLVREMEREERDVVWLVVDGSVELWAGQPGAAPLDRVMDRVADEAARRLRRGDWVGLVVTAGRLRTRISPATGAAHGAMLAAALLDAAGTFDEDRSGIDEAEVAQRILEHARPLDPLGLSDIARGDWEALARRAEQVAGRAPFSPALPFAATPRERALRRYLAAFGVESPPRLAGERERSEKVLVAALAALAGEKPRPTLVHVWAPPPLQPGAAATVLGQLRARRVHLRWSVPPLDAGIGGERERRSPVADAMDAAVRARAQAMRTRGERLLRRLGAHVESDRGGRPASERP